MTKLSILALLLAAVVCITLANPAKRSAAADADAEPDAAADDGGDGGDDALLPDADLTVIVDGAKATLVCGDEATKTQARKKGKGKQIPLHAASEDACKSLAHVEDLNNELKLPAAGSADPCAKEAEEPKEVAIEGRFKGKKVNYKRKFRNKCQLQKVAPEVFDIKNEAAAEIQGRKKGKKGAPWVHWGRR